MIYVNESAENISKLQSIYSIKLQATRLSPRTTTGRKLKVHSRRLKKHPFFQYEKIEKSEQMRVIDNSNINELNWLIAV